MFLIIWYKAIIVWFSQFIMTVVQNQATLSEKRGPGTGSSPKTAGSQSVKTTCWNVYEKDQMIVTSKSISPNKDLHATPLHQFTLGKVSMRKLGKV